MDRQDALDRIKLICIRDTLLRRFLEDSIEEHEPPVRAGTPKGSPIGMSSPKYLAVLLCGITGMKGTDLANLAGINYGSLRQWKLEESFQETAERAAGQFCVRVLFRLKEVLEEAVGQGGDLAQFLENYIPLEFADAVLYSEDLVRAIGRGYFESRDDTARNLTFCYRDEFIAIGEKIFGQYIPDVGRLWTKEWLLRADNRLQHLSRNTSDEDQNILLQTFLNVNRAFIRGGE